MRGKSENVHIYEFVVTQLSHVPTNGVRETNRFACLLSQFQEREDFVDNRPSKIDFLNRNSPKIKRNVVRFACKWVFYQSLSKVTTVTSTPAQKNFGTRPTCLPKLQGWTSVKRACSLNLITSYFFFRFLRTCKQRRRNRIIQHSLNLQCFFSVRNPILIVVVAVILLVFTYCPRQLWR